MSSVWAVLSLPIMIEIIACMCIFIEEHPTSGKVHRHAVVQPSNKQPDSGFVCECVSGSDASSSVEILSHKEAYKCTTISCHIKELADLFLLITCWGLCQPCNGNQHSLAAKAVWLHRDICTQVVCWTVRIKMEIIHDLSRFA